MVAFQSEPLCKIKPLCQLFRVHIETLARKKRGEETEGKQRAARVGTWKHENYWGSMVFIISICSANLPVYLFMYPVLCPPFSVCMFSVGMFPASSYFCQCYFLYRILSTFLKAQHNNAEPWKLTLFKTCTFWDATVEKYLNLKRSVFRIPQKLWLGVMVFNCSHFKNDQTRYTKWWRNVGEHFVFNLSTFRWHHLQNKLFNSNHLQSSTFSGCCESISNVCRNNLVGIRIIYVRGITFAKDTT